MARAAIEKKKPKAEIVSDEKVRAISQVVMADFVGQAKIRYEKAHKLFETQDDETQDAIERIVTLLCRIARKNMWIRVDGRTDRVVLTIPEETVYHNMFYMGVEIIKDLATFDVRVANFEFSPVLCATCYADVKPAKKKPIVKKKGKN